MDCLLSSLRRCAAWSRTTLAYLIEPARLPQVLPWLVAAGAIAAALLIVTWPPANADRVRWVGLVLQVLATARVAHDIAAARRRFSVPGPLAAVRDWWSRRPWRARVGVLQGYAGALSGSFATAVAGRAMGPEVPIEQRLQAIVAELEDIKTRLERAQREAQERHDAILRTIAAESKVREHAIAGVRDLVKQSQTDGLEHAAAALVCIIVGSVLSTVPEEVVRLLNWRGLP